MSETTELYERVGGEAGVSKLVDAFYTKVLEDPQLSPFFKETSMEKLRGIQREFISQALGGPLQYSGRPLSEVHHGRGIKRTHFQHWVELFLETLKGFELSASEIDDIIARVVVDVDSIVGESNVDG